MSNKLTDMLEDDKLIVTLEEASWPVKPTNPTALWEKDWLSQKTPAIKDILTFSFDRMKELSDIDNITSCDAFFYHANDTQKDDEDITSFLFEFKDTDSKKIVDKYLADKTSDKNYEASINRKISDSAKILRTIEFDGISGDELVGQTHVVIVYKDDIRGSSTMYNQIEKPVKGGKKRAKGASRISFLEDSLGNMENPKKRMEKSFGNSAEYGGYKKTQLSKDELAQMKKKLDDTSQNAGYKKYEMIKKENRYVTVLNRDEFAKIFKDKWSEVFASWDWEPYMTYFNNANTLHKINNSCDNLEK